MHKEDLRIDVIEYQTQVTYVLQICDTHILD